MNDKKGVYVLVLKLKRSMQIKVGKLGVIDFEGGCYIYVGSAQNGLDRRLKRHKSKHKKLFWHIDYFLNESESEISNIMIKESQKSVECEIAQFISKEAKDIPNFGSSDCKCRSHFFKVEDADLLKILKRKFDLIEYDE